MSNHPNRGSNRVIPRPEDVQQARLWANLTQQESANLVHVGLRGWQKWEGGEARMPGSAWELYRIKIGLLPAPTPVGVMGVEVS